MSEPLADRRCVPCEGGVKPYTEAEARAALAALNGAWRLDAAARHLEREYRFKDFYRVMSFANAVAHVANREDHHPDLELGYDYCRVRYTTHAIKGLSENDFICAAKIDRL
ncbi:MAG TPA: 4a-hydroxytetrahydrobiopterin dehydratase [Steroidobacteraceae bacterium]|nr:4a-hydroxytetrahydrobiopterin dehydratase [Steroidobacteraceae bacterium]